MTVVGSDRADAPIASGRRRAHLIMAAGSWPRLPTGVERLSEPVTVVIPVLNGTSYLPAAHARLVRALSHVADDFRLIFVDDGSSDGTWQEICRMASSSAVVDGIRLERNVGQAGATAAGLSFAGGTIAATIDVDLEAFPEDLPLLFQAVDRGADLASGRRTGARGWVRGMSSRVFNARVRRSGLPLHDLGCGMNAMTAEVAQQYVAHGDIRRALPKSLLVSLAPRVVEVPVRSSKSRSSTLGFSGLVNYWIEFEAMHGGGSRRSCGWPGYSLAWLALLLVVLARWPLTRRGLARRRTAKLLFGLFAAASLTSWGAIVRMVRRRRSMPCRPGFDIAETTFECEPDSIAPIQS